MNPMKSLNYACYIWFRKMQSAIIIIQLLCHNFRTYRIVSNKCFPSNKGLPNLF